MLAQKDFLDALMSRPGSDIKKNRIRKLIELRIIIPANGRHHKHHIFPTSWSLEHSKNKNNIVHLTYREHYVIHKMLHRAFPDDIPMLRAFHLMSTFGVGSCKGATNFAGSNQYDESRKWLSIQMTEHNPMKRVAVKTKKAEWESDNYHLRDAQSLQNFRTNNPMNRRYFRDKMVSSRKSNGTYTAENATHLRQYDEDARERMKNSNPMKVPGAAKAMQPKRLATIKSFDYWKRKFFDTHVKSKQIEEFFLNKDHAVSHNELIKKFNINRDFAVSIAKRFNEQNGVFVAVKGVS